MPHPSTFFVEGWEPRTPAGYYSGATMSWIYDAFSNRTAQTVGGSPKVTMPTTSTVIYTAASNQVATSNGTAFTYDAAGDVTNDGINSYLYDAEGRLCAVKNSNASVTGYIYDAASTRVAKGSLSSFSCNFSSNGFLANTSWVLGPGGEQVTEYAVSGPATSYTSSWTHTNAFSGAKITATYAWSNSAHTATDTYFYLGDWLGTKRVEASAGGCVSEFPSLPYGDALPSAPIGNCYADATEHHFTGKERDTESGNDYFGARYYASSMGRWLSPDWSAKVAPVPYAKLDNPQTLNLYSYMRDNPLGGSDPDGHCDWCQKINNWRRGDGFVTNMNLKEHVSTTETYRLPSTGQTLPPASNPNAPVAPNAGTYVTNRDLSAIGDSSRSKLDPITHTFTFTVNEDGSITTYSWGNSANLRGWSMNQPEDLTAASDSLNHGNATEVAPFAMADFYQKAFDQMNHSWNDHGNGLVTNNCKTETQDLGQTALWYAFHHYNP
ncbi:MAG: RHS repeat-associated core domain-containing protein [Terracidiphilus sp.]